MKPWRRLTVPAFFYAEEFVMEAYYPYIGIAIRMGIYLFFEEQADKRRIKLILAENDQMWSDLVNKNLKAIAEAYQKGDSVKFNIERI